MRNKILPLLGLAMLCINTTIAQNNQWSSARPDGHAPINVMADHYHKKGEFMFSYKYMPMRMEGNLSKSEDISNEGVYDDFMIAPQEMTMNMHMLGMMYAPSDNLTLMVMGNYISNSMDLRTGMGVDFNTESSGISDLKLAGLIKILNQNKQSLHATVGVSIPTGNFDQRGATPMADNAQLAYPMQLGSGTWDPISGLTYNGQSEKISWGAQANYLFRAGENSEDYTLGNKFDATSWGAVRISERFSASTSLSFFDTGSIDGADADMNPMMMPLFDTQNSGRNQLDLGIGSNYYVSSGKLKDLRLAVEVKFPISQHVNGIQMKNETMFTAGVQYTLGHNN